MGASEHRGIGASGHRSIGASGHRGVGASEKTTNYISHAPRLPSSQAPKLPGSHAPTLSRSHLQSNLTELDNAICGVISKSSNTNATLLTGLRNFLERESPRSGCHLLG